MLQSIIVIIFSHRLDKSSRHLKATEFQTSQVSLCATWKSAHTECAEAWQSWQHVLKSMGIGSRSCAAFTGEKQYAPHFHIASLSKAIWSNHIEPIPSHIDWWNLLNLPRLRPSPQWFKLGATCSSLNMVKLFIVPLGPAYSAYSLR